MNTLNSRANRHPGRWLCLTLMLLLVNTTLAQTPRNPHRPRGTSRLADPSQRQATVDDLRRDATQRRQAARAWAQQRNLPTRRVHSNHRVEELMFLDGTQPIYYTTLNANAAISTAANLLHTNPHYLDGTGGTVGIWDAGSVLYTHREFGSRITIMNGAPSDYHATHVGGTIAAAGIDTSAKGMAPAVTIKSYDWDYDLTEMTAAGMSYPFESDKLQLSNHSYGIYTGWSWAKEDGEGDVWTWHGQGSSSNSVDKNFGRYMAEARSLDSLAYNLPWYQVFIAAGNDRNDTPTLNAKVRLGPSAAITIYNPISHPQPDSSYRNGFDTISFYAVAKNVITVGSIQDAVTGGQRDLSKATISAFTSWGPTDDGRIKPDLVANGYALRSSGNDSNSNYGSMSGTSMATPNATGTAQLLLQHFGNLFPGHAMRASTLKALLIHTADDRGTPGPDYKFGWGVINAAAAADLLSDYHAHAGTRRIIEDIVTTNRPSASFDFTWDGTSPIRATLCWTDPPGTTTNNGDDRSAKLVNNLDLAILAPDTSIHLPWVMPFVGDWSLAAFDYPATTGTNSTDNVEQVLIATPTLRGRYTVRVTWRGTLTNGAQPFSLLLSGAAPQECAPRLQLTGLTPQIATGLTYLDISGSNFMLGARAILRQNGQADVQGSNIVVYGDTLSARFETTNLATGWWRVLVTNPDHQRATLHDGFAVLEELWREDFESGDPLQKGWSSVAAQGANYWRLSTTKSNSPANSMFAPGPATTSDTSLITPPRQLPPDLHLLRLTFWHDYNFTTNDGGVLELSLDGGTWFDITSVNSGCSFTANGYSGKLGILSGNPLGNSRTAWVGSSSGFKEVTVTFNDIPKFAGQSLRMRWRLGTNSFSASTGWYIDDAALHYLTTPPAPPTGTSLLLK